MKAADCWSFLVEVVKHLNVCYENIKQKRGKKRRN